MTQTHHFEIDQEFADAVLCGDNSFAIRYNVVRCKDCKHSDDIPGGRFCRYGVCVDCVVDDDFFCRFGKRKEKPDENAGN